MFKFQSKAIHIAKRCSKALWYFAQGSGSSNGGLLWDYHKAFMNDLIQEARSMFPEGIDLHFEADSTTRLLEISDGAYYNVFLHFNNCYLKIDILTIESKQWKAYNIKRSLNSKQKHKEESQLAYHIAEQLALTDFSFYVLHLNKAYTTQNDVDLFKLKSFESAIEDSLDLQDIINEMGKIPDSSEIPDIAIGEHCAERGLCPYYTNCFEVKQNSVFELRQFSANAAVEQVEKGITEITELPEAILSPFQKIQKESIIQNSTYLSKGKLGSFIQGARFPIVFIDFEGYQASIPELGHHRPMSTVPFLFSAHIWESPEKAPKHLYHINKRDSRTPEKDFCEALVSVSNKAQTFVVYNSLFEKDIINKLRHLEPVHKDALEHMRDHIIDMQTLFEKPYIYHPAQNGSISLKAISDALLNEKVFEVSWIKNGLEACKYYEFLPYEKDQAQRNDTIKALVDYCASDTLSMYKIWLKLEELLK